MWLLLAAILGGILWWFARRWLRTAPRDPRLTVAYWRKSALVLGAYLLSILLGAGITRVMVGFNRSGYADAAMALFFVTWVLYGALWLLRVLPSDRPKPDCIDRSRYWLDLAAILTLAALATGARML